MQVQESRANSFVHAEGYCDIDGAFWTGQKILIFTDLAREQAFSHYVI